MSSSIVNDDDDDLPTDFPRRDDVTVALAAVRKACAITSRLQSSIDAIVSKADSSPVTVADFAAQAVVLRHLDRYHRDDAYIAEETSEALEKDEGLLSQILQATGMDDAEELKRCIDLGAKWRKTADVNSSRRTWCLDPIDGTKGFLRGGQYCVTLALIEDTGEATIGIVACPNLLRKDDDDNDDDDDDYSRGCIFVASRGGGCYQLSLTPGVWCKRIGRDVNSDASSRTSTSARFCVGVETGFGDPNGWCREMAKILHGEDDAIDPVTDDIRLATRIDSQAKYGVVARGDAEWYVRLPAPSYREWIWDVAAGVVVLEEAGGRVTDAHGQAIVFEHGKARVPDHLYGVLGSATPELHEALLGAFEKVSMSDKAK